MTITIKQIDAARALLGLDRSDIAEGIGVSNSTMTDYFLERTNIKADRLGAIVGFLETKGVVFEKGGVFLRKPEIQIYEGQVGFWAFYDDIYEVMKAGGANIYVNNVKEELFLQWLNKKKEAHDARMSEIKDYRVRILVEQGDENLAANYGKVEYRWTPKDKFSDISFYIYGHKTAIIEFQEDNVFISVLSSDAVTRAFKQTFMNSWENAIIPEVKD